ncbi:hypothetical protein T261_4575 [Streptomyces lydicus]|nr:hypothetical protein T261_4575 [Streptomyces lydicus]
MNSSYRRIEHRTTGNGKPQIALPEFHGWRVRRLGSPYGSR